MNLKIPDIIDGYANPAVGDIDGDGLPEIVTIRSEIDNIINGHAIAFEHDGTLKWESPVVFDAWQVAVALADLDADGDVEIMAGRAVLDHLGNQLFLGNGNGAIDIPFAADLDGDGDLEVLQGGDAFHHDGSVHYDTSVVIAHPQVGNLDDDPEPEVLLAGFSGLTLLEHDGTVVYQDQNPSGDASWWRPAAIHDVDGDGAAEILVSSNQHYNIYRPDLTLLWTASVQDNSGYAAGTAFDFIGAGYAQAMYADENFLFVYGEGGAVLLSSPRSSWTQAENPVVADVDDDGSAEIVVVSNGGQQPAVQVVRDVEDRWIQARRIWNQHAYHVTNVREDGTIPQHQIPSWQALNTFRTNAQIEGGAVCMPDPPG
ncbi:FG-GAP repeat domain-containing protein [Nannocystis pusilla]|uniref:FG-GAP repeat domain-containing protein n=1 Tax=Nannocystis pusilla TaxID=889268 RepID=UPI003DA5D282